MAEHTQETELQHLIRLFRDALTALGTSPTDHQLEAWSIVVHASMSGSERNYHGVQHVFDVADGAEPIQALAALFHDTVYVQADGYLSKRHEVLLADVTEKVQSGFRLRPYDAATDRRRAMLEAVFGLEQGAILSPWWGLNEFLSAMLALRSLDGFLPDHLLVQIAAGIEATVPFRPRDERGLTPSERLLERLEQVNRRFDLGMDDADLERAVHQAVDVANRDVAGFAFDNSARFLDYTWKLLPEANIALRRKTYTLGEYRIGLSKMAGFFANLAPETVFFQFRSVPDDRTVSELTDRASTNIQCAHRYLGAKLAAVSVLDALAILTGGDAPMALFMGDLPEPGHKGMRMEDFLPPPGPLHPDANENVFSLLDDGLQNDSGFDLKNSPLAACIYARMGESGVKRLTAEAVQPMDTGAARRLLEAVPEDLLTAIASACAKTAVTRERGLMALTIRRPPTT